jgi:hypothetical protein
MEAGSCTIAMQAHMCTCRCGNPITRLPTTFPRSTNNIREKDEVQKLYKLMKVLHLVFAAQQRDHKTESISIRA